MSKENDSADREKHYCELLIKDQVQAQVDEILRKKREFVVNLAKIVVPTVTVLLGILGITQYLSINSLQDKLKNAETLATTAKEKVDEAGALKEKADKNMADSIALMGEAIKLMGDNNRGIAISQGDLFKAQGELANTQSRLQESVASAATTSFANASAAKANADAAASTQQSIGQIQEQLKSILGDMNQQAADIFVKHRDIEDKSKEVGGIHKNLLEKKEGLLNLVEVNQRLLDVGTQLVRSQSSYSLVLRAHQESSPIKLLDIANPAASTPARFYEIILAVDGMGKQFPLKYKIQKPGDATFGEWIKEPVHAQPKKTSLRPQRIPIEGLPYVIEVEYVTYGWFVNDCVNLKIRPA
jgi:hypothetical protein